MTDKPILFSGPMVRAILEGRKTQTRRIIKPHPKDLCDPLISYAYGRKQYSWPTARKANGDLIWCEPPWQLGEKLWVRETWAHILDFSGQDLGVQALCDRGFYRADENANDSEIRRWTPSIHMPRWASRITLIVTNVGVQRLQDITESDAKAEGFKSVSKFAEYWDSLTGQTPYFHENPWVSVVEFKPVFENIDRIGS